MSDSCSPCSPANVVFQAACTDPGSATTLRHLTGLDSQFCERRILPGDGGYLVARATGSGGWLIGFTTEPVVPLSNFTAAQTTAFGNLVVQGSDNIMRTLTGPAVANLYMSTNAAGQLSFGALPAATVPDPLTVGVANVITTLNAADVNITGTVTATGLATGTLTSIVGLNASNQLIKGTIANTGSQCAAFYEAAVSPAPTGNTPNVSAVSGNPLIIGNLLFDSTTTAGNVAGLFAVTNSVTLTCLIAGTYVADFGGMVVNTLASESNNGKPNIALSVNGIIVNSGNASNNNAQRGSYQNVVSLWGQEMRRYAVGDTIQLVLGSNTSASSKVYEVRCNLTRLGA